MQGPNENIAFKIFCCCTKLMNKWTDRDYKTLMGKEYSKLDDEDELGQIPLPKDSVHDCLLDLKFAVQ